jgi:hypothetical protein
MKKPYLERKYKKPFLPKPQSELRPFYYIRIHSRHAVQKRTGKEAIEAGQITLPIEIVRRMFQDCSILRLDYDLNEQKITIKKYEEVT